MARCFCSHGWVCEQHPDTSWPHVACPGPGMHCVNPQCPHGKENLAQQVRDAAHNREHYPNGFDEQGKHRADV
jgi:hypothetical protein